MSISGAAATYYYVLRNLKPCEPIPHEPQTVIIAPIKNKGPHLHEFLRRLRTQNYANARIIVAVESIEDPAYAIATESMSGPGLPLTVIVAGLSDHTGQKVWNLLAALERLEPEDQIIAFVDADTLTGPNWLIRLVGPIIRNRAEVTSGYRWMMPYGRGLGSDLVAVIDHAIATTPRWRYWNTIWGGTVAVRRNIFDKIDLPKWWTGAMSDDAQLIRAVWANKRRVVCPPGLFIPSPIDHTFLAAIEFARRQYTIVRTHYRRFWLAAAFVSLSSLTMCATALVLAVKGDTFPLVVLAAAFAAAQARFFLRLEIERWILAESQVTEPVSRPWRLWLASFGAPVFNVGGLLAAWSSRRVRWSGIEYEIIAPQNIRIKRS